MTLFFPCLLEHLIQICHLFIDYQLFLDLNCWEFLLSLWKGGPGQPQNLGGNFSLWMLLERVRFTLDGLECNKIGVSYEAFNGQPNFCASPFWSCLHNQLWNFREVCEIEKLAPYYNLCSYVSHLSFLSFICNLHAV